MICTNRIHEFCIDVYQLCSLANVDNVAVQFVENVKWIDIAECGHEPELFWSTLETFIVTSCCWIEL